MKNATKDLLRHPLVVGAAGAVAVIAVASIIYYVVATRLPSSTLGAVTTGSIKETVTATGTVTPAQNPNLAFVSGGRVADINVKVGDKVSQGQVLASLDTSTLSAQRAQAEANVAAQQATLDGMQAGARTVDVTAKQTAVAQAQSALASLYATVPTNLQTAYDKSFSGVSADTDTLFNQPNTPSPTLAFTTNNSQEAVTAVNSRSAINGDLANWKIDTDNISSAATPAQLDAELQTSINHLVLVRDFSDTMLSALSSAIPSSNFGQSSINAAQVSVAGLRDATNSLILTLQGEQQQITAQELAITAAQNALAQTSAGSTPQQIEAQQAQIAAAQAAVESINAQIGNAIIVAPFTGTVASVQVKNGDIVAPNTTAVSLNPTSAQQVDVYLSEVDAAKVVPGNSAVVTLDAYGSGHTYAATVVSVDHAPTIQNNIPAYKATLQFAQSDPTITSGLSANVTIAAAEKDNVLVIPLSAVIQNNNQSFVLVPSDKGSVQQPIQTGIESDTMVEVVSGLTAGQQFLINGH